jgi:hypothetical protein
MPTERYFREPRERVFSRPFDIGLRKLNLGHLGWARPAYFRCRQAKVTVEVHDERPPFAGVDSIVIAIHQYGPMEVDACDSHLVYRATTAELWLVLHDVKFAGQHGFELNGAFKNPRRRYRKRPYRRYTGCLKRHALGNLDAGEHGQPIDCASFIH